MHGNKAGMRPFILIVDHQPAGCERLANWLRAEGYHCLQATSVGHAWRQLQDHEIALVALDLAMPDGLGLGLLKQIGGQFPDTAVIVLADEGRADTTIAAFDGDARGYLFKPVDRESLVCQVRRALERRGMLIENRNYTLHLERRVREQTRSLQRAYEEAIHHLVSACACRDVETGGHVKRTGALSELLARAAGWDAAAAECLRLAAPMHDIGKIGIPDSILQKPGRLTVDEFEVMKQHTAIGAEILSGSDSNVLKMAETIALYHHERWNGRGYPAGLAGEDIPQVARIVGIVDVYDALTHGRIYRPALSEAEALSMMLDKSGSHFDPDLLELFLSLLPEMRAISEQHGDQPNAKGRPITLSPRREPEDAACAPW